MSLPLSTLCSGRFDLSHLYTALLFMVNIPSSREVSLQNGTAKQTSPGITPRMGQTLTHGPQSGGLTQCSPAVVLIHPTALLVPPGKPALLGTHEELLESETAACWEEISVAQNTFSGVWFHSPNKVPGTQASVPCSPRAACRPIFPLTGYLEYTVFRYCSGYTAARRFLFLTCELCYLHIPLNLFLTF